MILSKNAVYIYMCVCMNKYTHMYVWLGMYIYNIECTWCSFPEKWPCQFGPFSGDFPWPSWATLGESSIIWRVAPRQALEACDDQGLIAEISQHSLRKGLKRDRGDGRLISLWKLVKSCETFKNMRVFNDVWYIFDTISQILNMAFPGCFMAVLGAAIAIAGARSGHLGTTSEG